MLQQAGNSSYQATGIAIEMSNPGMSHHFHPANRFAQSKDYRLQMAGRIFGLIPLVVFLITLALFAGQAEQSPTGFAQVILRVLAVSLASSLVCIAAHGFYRYLLDRSHGL